MISFFLFHLIITLLYCILIQNQKYMSVPEKLANSASNVKVVCRFRPINQRQKLLGAVHAHQLMDQKTVAIKNQQSKDLKDSLKFSFDKVFDVQSTQKQVYDYAAASVIDSVIQGFNGTIFAYGQTSSGKTHTMQGQVTPQITELSGIIPRMVKHVFDAIQTSSQNIQFRIKVSLVELYMQKLRDLLDPQKSDLKIRSDKKRGIFIQDLTQNYISSPYEVYKLIDLARNSRAIASTNMNERSSRSHMIFLLTISQNNVDDLSAKTGKLYLVDLAGSEKIGKTGAEGKTLDQAKKINASLTALGKVINSLTDGKSTHIPYRDSKLTRVLQQSLGGNSKTSLIVTCSPHPNNMAQTISTLRFGISAKKIKNKPKINKQMTVAQLQNLLQKAQKQVIQRDRYVEQLKNYITVDLKQKSAPQFQADKSVLNLQNQQNDLMNELERQLQMQRNLHLVQQEQINTLKIKCDQIISQRQDMEKQLEILRNKEQLRIQAQNQQKNAVNVNQGLKISRQSQKLGQNQITTESLLKQLQKITSDQNVLNFISTKTKWHLSSHQDHNQLLQEYEQQKEKRKKAEQHMVKYEKNMQKKLMQLQNNICQLTHAYYDLVVVQQRYKVDNIFLKKKLDQKDMAVLSLKEKIKDLQDQNRQLQQQWNEDDTKYQSKKLRADFQQSNMKFEQALQKKGMGSNIAPHSQHSKVVKVLKGGLK